MHREQGEHKQMIKRVSYLLTVGFLLAAFAFNGIAADLSDYKNQLKEANSQASEYKKKITQTKNDINWNKKKRDEVIRQLEEAGLKKEDVDQQIQLLESALLSLDEAISIAEQEFDHQMELLKERLCVMYKKSVTVWQLDELFKSKSLNELILRIRLMNQIAEYDQMLLDSIEEKKLEIEELKEQKQIEVENCLEQARQYAKQIEELEISRSSLDKEIKSDQKTLEQYEREQDALIKESKDLETLIKNMESSSNLKWGGKLIWPMPTNSKISSPYGNRLHPIYKVWKMHTGIDIGSALNEYIVAAGDGIVKYASSRDGYGNTIIIDHGSGITTLYAHINKKGFMVKVGQQVKAGDTIAKAGMTGTATGPHLHFEVRKNGAVQNPLEYVKKP